MANIRNQIQNLKVVVAATFLGTIVSFKIADLTSITSIQLIRSTTKSSGAATVIKAVPLKLGQFSYNDGDPAIVGMTVYYWVQVTVFSL